MPSEARCFLTDADLDAFALKVEALRADGIKGWALAERLGVTRTTINDRMSRWRRKNETARSHP